MTRQTLRLRLLAAALAAVASAPFVPASPSALGRGADSAGNRLSAAARARADFDGDGFSDLAVGVPLEDVGIFTIGTDSGSVNTLYGTASGLSGADDQTWSRGDFGVQGIAGPAQRFGSALAAGDFNGDGVSDLAVGLPTDASAGGLGTVHVLYGSAGDGLRAAGDQIWNQDVPGVAGAASSTDSFGSALAAGDFDADGFADLAVGAFGATVNGAEFAGEVTILYGTPTGLSAARSQLIVENDLGPADASETNDQFGSKLAAGDFDGDGADDLAVGVPDEDVLLRRFNIVNAGAVRIVFGATGAGLTTGGAQTITQNAVLAGVGIADASEAGDRFGSSLAAGDLDGDGFDDLAVGVPFETVDIDNRDGTTSTFVEAGAVNAIYGSTEGLAGEGNQFWHQGVFGVQDAPEAEDHWGSALAIGDFDGDGAGDLAVGAHNEDVGSVSDAGGVSVLYGFLDVGLAVGGNQFFTQNTSGISGAAAANDQLGFALTTGDYDGDLRDDLVIGVPLEDLEGDDAGVVHVLYGTASGLSGSGSQTWGQGVAGIAGVAENGDLFGRALR